ncbi:Fur family transcriptional regulator [Falsarthrobacter nasiphocae]|uniref:Fur family ferric uptake transcriptional regulator n=1 Tax=Falsarthrobacter nasiphocae TaxID=189863 RepID=A0AAE4C6M7_9MICC|nr:Fur family transcriptional regulator [Falsarthrobacter nasiphocae]MDR6892748.1 Fur family ferric uptake transcriptional regulator [Falsarthrobacter nasiphocae]
MASPTGQRITKQRVAVSDALQALPDFVSAQEMHRYLVDGDNKVSLATTYRILTQLADDGLVDTVRREDGETVYRRCEVEAHHHHLVCTRCGRAVEIETPAVEELVSRAAEAHGYTSVRHTMEIFGLCPACTAELA